MDRQIVGSSGDQAEHADDPQIAAAERIGAMSTPDEGDCIQWLRRIDDALNSTSGAMLTLERFDEVMRLRRQVRAYCDAGRTEDARLAAEAAMAILSPRMQR